MTQPFIRIADDFWNIRGSFKLGNVVEIGTHASLVRLADGRFVFLDAYTLEGSTRDEVMALTDKGQNVAAIINLHPFHTVHCARMHGDFPGAKLYGSARHAEKLPDLPWQPERVNQTAFQQLFADDFDFSLPAGVDFISRNENIHFSSVLARHRASRTIHVDDTLMYIELPKLLGLVGLGSRLSFHLTLAQALERRAGAAADFRQWARTLAEDWGDARAICTAHTANVTAEQLGNTPARERILAALDKVESKLAAHERKHG